MAERYKKAVPLRWHVTSLPPPLEEIVLDKIDAEGSVRPTPGILSPREQKIKQKKLALLAEIAANKKRGYSSKVHELEKQLAAIY